MCRFWTLLLPTALLLAALITAPALAGERLWRDEIIYVVIPQKFADGDPTNNIMAERFADRREELSGGLWGGDLAGVIDKLDYIADLGVTTLFLYPFMVNDRDEFFGFLPTGYRVRDYFGVDENFGTTETARQLVAGAHARGLRVILDLPIALSGNDHPFNTPEHREQGYFTGGSAWGMPIWNVEHPVVREHIMEVGEFWIDLLGVDGYRIDSAHLLPREFWREFAEAMRARGGEDFFLLAEIPENPRRIGSFITETGFDSAYDFSTLTSQKVFGGDTPLHMISFIQSEAHQFYPNPLKMIGEIDNYEDPEFVEVAADPVVPRLRLALAWLLTFDRIPMLFSGSEIGLSYDEVGALFDKDNDNPELRDYVKRLIAVRKAHAPLRRGTYREEFREDPILAYTRTYEGQQVLVILNNSNEEQTAGFPLGEEGAVAWTELELHDLMEGGIAKPAGEAAPITLSPYGAAIVHIGPPPAEN